MLFAILAFVGLSQIPRILGHPPIYDAPVIESFSGPVHYFFDIWARWDAEWFLKIAHQGYSTTDSSTAFFPLYPLLLAVVKPLFIGNGVLAGIFISLACCLAAFYWLFRLVEIDFDKTIARDTVLFMAVFPTSFFLQTIYSESLFLALTISSIYAARRRKYALASILGALATLTRSAGILLVVPLVIIYMQDRHWNWRAIRWDALYVLLVPVGLTLWILYLGLRFDDPWLFSTAQSSWYRHFDASFIKELYRGLEWAWKNFQFILGAPGQSLWPEARNNPGFGAIAIVSNFAFTVVFLALSIVSFWRLPLAYAAYAFMVVLTPLFFPSMFMPLYSMPRFVLMAFPIFILLAIWGTRYRWFKWLVLTYSLIFLGLFTAMFVTGIWVA